jgi:hypothetical protein
MKALFAIGMAAMLHKTDALSERGRHTFYKPDILFIRRVAAPWIT